MTDKIWYTVHGSLFTVSLTKLDIERRTIMATFVSQYAGLHKWLRGSAASRRRHGWVIGILILVLSGCSLQPVGTTPTGTTPTGTTPTQTLAPPSPTATITEATAIPESTPLARVIVSPAQAGQTIVVRVNQQIVVLPMSTELTWQVDYDSSILTALTPADKMSQPGPDGWLFQAAAVGQTDLVMTSVPAPCPPGTPCAPMPARVGVAIQVQP
ncbi:MAG: hypothetical protein WAV53_02340 [Anaerolineae bacterium]